MNKTHIQYTITSDKSNTQEILDYFSTLDLNALEVTNAISQAALQERRGSAEERLDYYEEFNSIYSEFDEELVVERLEELENCKDYGREGLYLKDWYKVHCKSGKYKKEF